MNRVQGSGLIMAGAVLLVIGIILRWDLIDWLIDATGFVLIVIGAILGVVGLIKLFTSGNKKSYDEF
jgi:xanthine/uracil permease